MWEGNWYIIINIFSWIYMIKFNVVVNNVVVVRKIVDSLVLEKEV